MTVTDSTAAQLIWAQSRRGDFLRVLAFYDVDPVTKVRTAKDLTGYEFFFRVLGPDGTEWITGEIGDGITVVDHNVRLTIDLEQYDAENKVLLLGCTYKMEVDMMLPTGFYKPLIEAKLSMT